jgi:hypothetical protein
MPTYSPAVGALLLHHLLLVAASAALAAFGWRVAGLAGAAGLERGVGAAVVAAAAAGISALAWGLAGLGGEPLVLAGTAVALWVASTRLPAPERRGGGAMPGSRRRSVAGWAAAGAGVAWFAWLARYPALGIDPLTYHLPEAVLWAQGGHPGRGEEVVYEFPIQNYPLTAELLIAWGIAIGRSLGPAMALVPLAAALFACAGWAALRRLGVPRAPAALAIAAILLLPLTARQMHGPHTDLPALAWLAATWCLSLAARDRTPVLALALVAGGLAIGTKTTVAPFVLGALVVAGWRARHALRARIRPLALGLAAATAVGGVWYLRNLIEHGSPLWPFVATPWGDALPPYLAAIDTAFLERPLDTLRGRESTYVNALAGGLILLPVALLAVLTRRRAVVVGAAAVAAGALLWGLAPFTGRHDDPVIDLSISTPRYLLPTLAAAAATLALAARRSRWPAWVLAAAALWSLERTLALPFPGAPSLTLLLAGAAAGALAFPVARRAPVLLAAAAAAVLLTAVADDLPRRHAAIGQISGSGVMTWLEDHAGEAPVHFAPGVLGVASGDRLQRPLRFIARDEPCERVRERDGWVVIALIPNPERRAPFTARDCFTGVTPAYEEPFWRVYDVRQTASTSRQASRPSSRTAKSAGVIAAERGSSTRRARVSSRS